MRKHLSYLLIILIITASCKQNEAENIKIKTPISESNQNIKTKSNIQLKLINTESKKEINLLDLVDINTVLNEFGKPILIEKEKKIDLEDGEEPWTTIKYDGLVIEFVDGHFSDITIDKKQWRISNIEIGKTESDIEIDFKKMKRESYNYSIFEIPNFDGVLFSEVNKDGKIIKFGISTSQG